MRRLVVAPLLLAMLLPACGGRETAMDLPPERVVLIVIDTLRRDHVSAYGNSPVRTPHLDALARRGQIFTNAYASFHQTTMSMASLFTGRTPSLSTGDPREHLEFVGRSWCGMMRFADAGASSECIPESLPTLAGRLAEAGYWTAGVVTNRLLHRPGGYDQGFDRWEELPQRAPKWTQVNWRFAEVVQERPQDRFFLYVHYMDVHDRALHGRTYEDGVERADKGVGQLMQILEGLGLVDGTLVIVTSDHGERLGEEHFVPGIEGHMGNPSFETVLEVPLIAAPPVFPDPDAVVRTDDLHRMILDVVGVGASPRPDLAPGELFLSERLYQTYRSGRWKSYRQRESGRLHLVDLEADPGERRDVAAQHPEVVARHRARLDQLNRELAVDEVPPLELSDGDRERLRALGYVE